MLIAGVVDVDSAMVRACAGRDVDRGVELSIREGERSVRHKKLLPFYGGESASLVDRGKKAGRVLSAAQEGPSTGEGERGKGSQQGGRCERGVRERREGRNKDEGMVKEGEGKEEKKRRGEEREEKGKGKGRTRCGSEETRVKHI